MQFEGDEVLQKEATTKFGTEIPNVEMIIAVLSCQRGTLDRRPGSEQDARRDGEKQGLQAQASRHGKTVENHFVDRSAVVDDRFAEIEVEEIFKYLIYCSQSGRSSS